MPGRHLSNAREAAVDRFFRHKQTSVGPDRAEFVPGKILGLPVKSQFFVEVKFAPTTRDNVSAKSY